MLKIAYGSYGMPEIPIWDALPRLAELGYEGVELCVAERWPTAPHKLSAADRQRLRSTYSDLNLELPALMLFVNLLAPEGEELDAQVRLYQDACALARDLSPGTHPVLTCGLGACKQEWDEAWPLIVERTAHFGELSAREGCRLALEPHVGPLLNSPERTLALLEKTHSPSLGINFDISHFEVAGYPRAETIRKLAPYAIHTHVKDGYMQDGKVQFQLPGEGTLDYAAYFREMAEAGWTGPITVEISGQIFNRPGYDAWADAQFSLNTLRRARAAAEGVSE